MGMLEKAESNVVRGLEIITNPNVEQTSRPVRHAIAKSKLELSRIQILKGNHPEEAEKLLDDSISIWEQIVLESPNFLTYQMYLADALRTRAQLEIVMTNLDDARLDLVKSQNIIETLFSKQELIARYHELASDIYITFSNLEKLNEIEEASTKFRRLAVERLEKAISCSPTSKRLSTKLAELKNK